MAKAGDADAAREAFEAGPTPRSEFVWKAMLEAANTCGDRAFASNILREMICKGGVAGGDEQELRGGD